MKRHVALLGLLAVSAALAGCGAVFGPGEPDEGELAENATYDWDTNASASILVNRSSYEAVYHLSNGSTVEAYRVDELGQEHNLPISSLQYRYPNGTVVAYSENSSAISVEQTRERTIITTPNDTEGQVAFTAPRHGKRFTTPVFLEGSYEVTLPPNARVGVPLLSQVSPRGYHTSVDGERMTVRWDEVTSDQVSVRYYLQRDLFIFTGVVVVASVVGGAGALYYYRQIRQAKRRRDEYGLDVDEDDDPRDRGPPPGMR